MAQQVNPNDPGALSPSSYSENHIPQFAGGSVDPSSGNLIPATASGISQGQAAPLAAAAPVPAPATPTTQLGNISAAPPGQSAPQPPSELKQALTYGAAGALAGAELGGTIGGPPGALIGGGIGGAIGFVSPYARDITKAVGRDAKAVAGFVQKDIVHPVSTFFDRAFHLHF